MQIRFITPLPMHGSIQFIQGQIADLPEAIASEFIARKEAVEVPAAEQAVMLRPTTIVIPRPKPSTRPKPETRGRKRGR